MNKDFNVVFLITQIHLNIIMLNSIIYDCLCLMVCYYTASYSVKLYENHIYLTCYSNQLDKLSNQS